MAGDDRARLLHAMSTNDVKNLTYDSGLYSFFLTAQGRILADAHIWNLGEYLLLETEPEVGRKLYDHLDRYIIADDAYLTDESQEWQVIALEGPRSMERAAELGLPTPETKFGLRRFEGGFVVSATITGPVGFRIFLAREQHRDLLDRLAGLVPQATPEEVRSVRLENGVPRYGEEISERYLVQETGLLDAVHPNKGCYLGQEIVERVRSRAQVHRHLRSIRVDGMVVPAAGTKLHNREGKDAAEIVSAAYSPGLNSVVGFAYVRTEALSDDVELSVGGTEPPVRARMA